MTWEPWIESPLEPKMGVSPSFEPAYRAYSALGHLLGLEYGIESEALERLGAEIMELEAKFAPSEPPVVSALEATFDAIERKATELTVRLEALDGLLTRETEPEPEIEDDEGDMLADAIDFEGYPDTFPEEWLQ